MRFSPEGALVVCRLAIEEAERLLREGYLSTTPGEDGELSVSIREARIGSMSAAAGREWARKAEREEEARGLAGR